MTTERPTITVDRQALRNALSQLPFSGAIYTPRIGSIGSRREDHTMTEQAANLSDDALREIARRASMTGNYSGGVKALRAVYQAGRVDVQKWLAAQLREDAAEFEEFAPGRAVELISYFLEYLTLPDSPSVQSWLGWSHSQVTLAEVADSR